MLITCPECSNQVSDKAESCPSCGYPFKKQKKYSKKRRKLPNGFGQISEIKGRNLERPYRAMVTIDKDVYGKPISKLLSPNAYFKTYNEAYEALLEFNRLRGRHFGNITMQTLFEEWFSKEQERLSKSRQKSIKNFWLQCENLYNIQIHSVTLTDVKDAITHSESYNYRLGVKGLLNRILNYAVEKEYISKNILAYVNVSLETEAPKTEHHISYTDDEIKAMWNNINPTTEFILVQCYTGFRPSELLNMKLTDVSIANKTMTGGMKTEAGKNRIVPIHNNIYEIVCNNFVRSGRLKSEYLFSSKTVDGTYTKMSLSALQRHIKSEMANLNLNISHSAHDGRKHFITIAKRDGVDEYAIKRIVGHRIKDITEDVYTDRSIEWLRTEIEKIK